MGNSPVLALLLPMSVVIGAVVYFVTGSLIFAVAAFAFDAIPAGFIYSSQLRSRRNAALTAQDRLARYSSTDR